MPDLTAVDKLREELKGISLEGKEEWRDFGAIEKFVPVLSDSDIDQICKVVGERMDDFYSQWCKLTTPQWAEYKFDFHSWLKAQLSKERKG